MEGKLYEVCEHCHRLPLHAGGCSLFCIKGGSIGSAFLGVVLMEAMLKTFKILTNNNERNKRDTKTKKSV